MKHYATWLVILLLYSPLSLSCDGFHYEIGAGKNTSLFPNGITWDDGGGIAARFAIRYEYKHGVWQYEHISQYDVGPPFDDDFESSLDSFTWNLRF